MPPTRIVSLVPSLTELVWWFGLGERLVGRTRFCIEPAGAIEVVETVGGTKTPHIERIVALEPDLVIANREENRREDVEALQAAGFDVLVTDPNTVAEALEMTSELGTLLGAGAMAQALVAETRAALAEPLPEQPVRVFVPIWPKPLMGLGCQSYGHDLLTRAGGENVLGDRPRYPEVTEAEVAALRPGLVLLPDEPYPFSEKEAPRFAAIAPVRLIDGKLLWWYGPRMPEAIRSLRALFAEGER